MFALLLDASTRLLREPLLKLIKHDQRVGLKSISIGQ